MIKGKLITLEGGEGAGKSTQAEVLVEWLQARDIRVEQTREPGGTPLAEAIRSILLAERQEPMPAETELLLLFAARSVHWCNRIKPALEEGRWVVCDRFVDASYAYQGTGRGIPTETISGLEEMVLNSQRPDLVLLLDLPVEEGLRRAAGRSPQDRFEREDLAFFTRVREGYLQRAKAQPQRVKVIDASQSERQVQAQIQAAVEQTLLGGEQAE